MTRIKLGRIFMALGVGLLVCAVLLLFTNREEAVRADSNAAQALTRVQTAIKEDHLPPPPRPEWDTHMTVTQIDGYGYIGYLNIPALDLELPVMDEWDDDRLKIAPCRQMGSTKSGDLVIAGHNYRRHFGPLDRLTAGDAVRFTDMDGAVLDYQVGTVEIVSPDSLDRVRQDGWDLVLYTCTYSGQDRILVGCSLTEIQPVLF